MRGERALAVPPMRFPNPNPHAPLALEEITGIESVTLFEQRAREARPDFALTPQNAHAVAAICRALEGIPLAIELAATRLSVLSVEDLLSRLEKRLDLLSAGARDLPSYQKTLRSAIAWSYDLLTPEEQRLFRRVSVFAGGFTLADAEAVCADLTGPSTGVLDGLASLIAKSLAQRAAGTVGETRFTMLEMIREYAAEQLSESGEAPELRLRHASHFLALAEEAEPELVGPRQGEWTTRLEASHGNFRAALDWLFREGGDAGWQEEGQTAAWAPRLCGALWQFWVMQGHVSEGRGWLDMAMASAASGAAGNEMVEVRIKILIGAGVLAYTALDFPAAWRSFEQGLAVSERAGDRRNAALALNNLGNTVMYVGDYPVARAYYERSLEIRREMGDTRLIAYSLNNLANLTLLMGNRAEARGYLEESLAIQRVLGDKEGLGHALLSLASIAHEDGDYGRAIGLAEETLKIANELGNKQGVIHALLSLGRAAHKQGNYAEAIQYYGGSLELSAELEHKATVIVGLEGVARVACDTGRAAQSSRLCGATEALREATGMLVSLSGQAEHEHYIAVLRARLGEPEWEKARHEGRAMSLEKAIAYALQEVPSALTPHPTAPV